VYRQHIFERKKKNSIDLVVGKKILFSLINFKNGFLFFKKN